MAEEMSVLGQQNIETTSKKNEGMPLVSISCITFNHGKYLRDALESFVNQKTDFPFEILVHDDASTDDTIPILKEYEEKYPEIMRVMYEEKNQYSQGISNISGVFNFPRARGKYIAMCEGDDFWSDMEKLQKQAEYMEAHEECAMCAHAAGIVSEDGAFRTESSIRPFEGSRVLSAKEVISKKTNLPTASLMFRTEFAQHLPKWYFDCPVGDIPLHLFMVSKGNVYYFDEKMSMYRMGAEGSWGNSMDQDAANEKWEKHFAEMKVMFEAFDQDTKSEYSEAVQEAVQRSRFLIDLKENKMESVLVPENAKFLSELPETEQRLLKLHAKHPFVYNGMRKLYFMLRGH